MTTDTVRLLARYNTHANHAMNQVLAGLEPDAWDQNHGGYFPSLRALTSHLYTVDILWLVRFTALRPFAAVQGSPFDFPPAFGQPAFGPFEEYRTLRTDLDAKIEAWAAEVADADLPRDLAYRNTRGEDFTKNFGGLVLHFFNHQTHHRGQISQVLDQLKVANDFSNLNAVL